MTLAQEAGQWAANLHLADWSGRALRAGSVLLADTAGVTLAGGTHPVVAAVSHAQPGAAGNAFELIQGRSLDPATAAFVNAVAAHILDYDDSAVGELIGHPSAVVLPAVWAVATDRDVDGSDMLVGYLAGVEANMRFSRAFGGGGVAYSRGFHTTTVGGVLGATLGAARAARLDEAQITQALGFAAALASGTRGSFGTSAKAIQVGAAARSAVCAVRLATGGLDSGVSSLDSEVGFPVAYFGDTADPEERIRRWHDLDPPPGAGLDALADPGVRIKPYAACRATHRSISAALELRQRAEIDPAQIGAVRCQPSPETRAILTYHKPQSGLEAKFSLEYAVAVALLDGAAGVAQFTDERVRAPDVQSLLARVELLDDGAQPSWTEPFAPETVTIECGGQSLAVTLAIDPGHPNNPLSTAQLRAKFSECVQVRFPDLHGSAASAAYDLISDVAAHPSARDLTRMWWAGLSTSGH